MTTQEYRMTKLEKRWKALEAEANEQGLTVMIALVRPMQPGDQVTLRQYGEQHVGDLPQQIEDASAELRWRA